MTPPASPVRVLLYEDNHDYREGLTYLLRATPDIELVGAFMHCRDVLADVRRLRPQVVLMDIAMPGRDGIAGTRLVKQAAPDVQVLMLTMFEDDAHIWDAVCAGATGYLLKSTPPGLIASALLEAHAGGAPMSPAVARRVLQMLPQRPTPTPDHALSERELEILKLLVNGHSYKMIAAHLAISIHTVRFHIQKVYQKLQVHSGPQAVAQALRWGLV